MILDGNFILLVILLMINLLLCAKRIPIVAFPLTILSMALCMIVFIQDTNIPANPYTTLLLGIVAVCALVANALRVNQR